MDDRLLVFDPPDSEETLQNVGNINSNTPCGFYAA